MRLIYRRSAWITVAAIVFCLAAASPVDARPYTLEWDANLDEVTAGYIVYYGTASGTYVPVDGVDVGNATGFQVNLTPGLTYYFVVRAYNGDAELGPPSAELSFLVPNVAPVLTNPGAQANAPGNVVSLSLAASDGDGDGLAFTSVTGLPPGLSANGNGQITGTLTGGSAGTYSVAATVSDGTAQDVENFAWRVISVSAPSSVDQGATITGVMNHAPGNAGDWVGLYRVGATIGEYCDWNYLNGSKVQPGTGLNTASLDFSSNCPGSGDLQLRFFLNNTATVLATAGPITVNSAQSAVITVNGTAPPTQVTAPGGSSLTTQIAISGPTYAGDWVGLYPIGGTVGQYFDWKYLNGTQVRPGAGTANATVSFTMPSNSGNYEIRFYSNDSANLVASSSTLTSQQTATLAVNGSVPPTGVTAAADSTLTVDVTLNAVNYPGDWVGLYSVGGTIGQYHEWKYLNGTQVRPENGSASASVTFTMPSSGGPFEVRLYSNDSSTLVTTSSAITLQQSASISVNSVSPPNGLTVSSGSSLTADIVISGPNFAGDWAGLYPVGGTIGQWIEWKYMNGTQSLPAGGTAIASITFTMPEVAGNYEIRVFSNNGGTVIGTSATLTTSQSAAIRVNGISAPSSAYVGTSSSLTVGITISGPTFAGDWVGLYPVGGALGQYTEWKYLNGTQTQPGAGTANATLSFTVPVNSGSYEVRLFSNNTGTLVGTGPTIHAASVAVNGTAPPNVYNTSPGAALSAQVQIAGTVYAGDWVGLFPVGGTTGQWIDWYYLNGTRVMPGAGTSTATIGFTAPSNLGTYEIRLYQNNTGTLIATGSTITVP